jgi:MFS family permease
METKIPPARKAGILINRNFAWLWTGQAISLPGDWLYETALVLWIATVIARGQSWGPLAVSGVLVAQSIPMLLIRPLAGVFVDRWDKRQTMLRMDAIRAVLIALLALVTGMLPLPFVGGGRLPAAWQLGVVYGVVFLAGICAQFFNPARLALTGDVVEEERRGRAFGLDYVTENIALIAGPPLGALLFFGIGIQWTLLLNAVSFAISFLCVLRVRPPQAASSLAPGERGHLLRELGAGARFLAGNRILVTVMLTVCIVMLGAGAINTLNVFFVSENLHAPASLYSLIVAGVGIGGIAGAAGAAFYVDRLGPARTYWMSIVALSILILIFARLTSLIPALIITLPLGFVQGGLNVAEGPILLRVTPRELVGRVNSIVIPAITLTSLLSTALAGALASTILQGFHTTLLGLRVGPIDTIFTASGVLVFLAGLYALVNLRALPAASPASEAPPAPAESPAQESINQPAMSQADTTMPG